MKTAFAIKLAAVLLLISTPTWAAQFYRWFDAEGNTYIQSYIPPEFVAGGYEIIDDAGNIVSVVAPQISEAERRANEEAQINEQMQQARDKELLKFYRSPSDVDRSMATWLSRMDMEIRVVESRIRIRQNEYDNLQSQAAEKERSGQTVEEELLIQMKNVQNEIDGYFLDIRQIRLRQDESRSDFMVDRDRMVILWQMINKKDWVEPVKSTE